MLLAGGGRVQEECSGEGREYMSPLELRPLPRCMPMPTSMHGGRHKAKRHMSVRRKSHRYTLEGGHKKPERPCTCCLCLQGLSNSITIAHNRRTCMKKFSRPEAGRRCPCHVCLSCPCSSCLHPPTVPLPPPRRHCLSLVCLPEESRERKAGGGAGWHACVRAYTRRERQGACSCR